MLPVEPADVESASASYERGKLVIRASGTVPNPCWKASIRQSPIDIWPPEFEAVRTRVQSVCPQVVRPFDVAESFELGTDPETITLHHAGGALKVQVEAGYGEAGLTSADEDVRYDEATGRSRRRLSFEEALENAVASLPLVKTSVRDWLDVVEVLSIKAEFGGIDGRSDLVVRVRRPRPPS